MFSQDADGQRGLVLTLVFGLVALVVALVMDVGIYQRNPAKTAAPAAGSATGAARASSDAASVRVENGVLKFYFASGKADLAAGAGEALADVVKRARSGRKLVISGFHDATGDPAKNAALARQRAEAVRDALKAAGASQEQIELKKPEQMAGSGSGSDAEARRVEISIQ